MKVPDIYFEKYWGILNEARDGGTFEEFLFEDVEGAILHRFIRRPTGLADGTFDVLSPAGFSGPVVLSSIAGGTAELVRKFDRAFQAYCESSGIVAEYIRFSPWLRNHLDFQDIYLLTRHLPTFGIDLTGDFFNEEFSAQTRRVIRRAEKSAIGIEFDFDCRTIDEFYKLYAAMHDTRFAADLADAMYDPAYFDSMRRLCRDYVFLINAWYGGALASSQLCLLSGRYLHGFLCANDPALTRLNAHSLITFKACDWGKAAGRTAFHFGAARTEGIYTYKKHFTRDGIYDFYIGRKIRLQDTYEELVALRGGPNKAYFPAYRG